MPLTLPKSQVCLVPFLDPGGNAACVLELFRGSHLQRMEIHLG